jgi:hypothetical protein
MIEFFTPVLAVLIGNGLTLVIAFFVYCNFFYQPEQGKSLTKLRASEPRSQEVSPRTWHRELRKKSQAASERRFRPGVRIIKTRVRIGPCRCDP